MSYYLFLDDTRRPKDVNWVKLPENVHWERAQTYHDFFVLLELHGMPKFIAYDCDLCDEHYQAYFNLEYDYVKHYKNFKTRCGIDCIDLMIEWCKKLGVKHPPYVCHTMNKYARQYMIDLIENYNKSVDGTPSS